MKFRNQTYWPARLEARYTTSKTPLIGTATIIRVIPEANLAIGVSSASNFLKN